MLFVTIFESSLSYNYLSRYTPNAHKIVCRSSYLIVFNFVRLKENWNNLNFPLKSLTTNLEKLPVNISEVLYIRICGRTELLTHSYRWMQRFVNESQILSWRDQSVCKNWKANEGEKVGNYYYYYYYYYYV